MTPIDPVTVAIRAQRYVDEDRLEPLFAMMRSIVDALNIVNGFDASPLPDRQEGAEPMNSLSPRIVGELRNDSQFSFVHEKDGYTIKFWLDQKRYPKGPSSIYVTGVTPEAALDGLDVELCILTENARRKEA